VSAIARNPKEGRSDQENERLRMQARAKRERDSAKPQGRAQRSRK